MLGPTPPPLRPFAHREAVMNILTKITLIDIPKAKGYGEASDRDGANRPALPPYFANSALGGEHSRLVAVLVAILTTIVRTRGFPDSRWTT
jgi:hypothetical protein